MNRQNEEKLLVLYDQFTMEEDPLKKISLRKEIVTLLEGTHELIPADIHIWGLVFYLSDDNKIHHKELALKKFLEAFKMDNTQFLSCLYAAHCYHDASDLNNALKYYQMVDQERLKSFQRWRYVKLIEQIGYCHYLLGNKKVGREHFENALKWYQRLPMEERPLPTEMMQCLPKRMK